jgi:1,4-dihydroxy-2-naphthoate octaprenyltransferase
MVYNGSTSGEWELPWQGMLISSLLFGGFYPLTQIYQHEQDLQDGVETISYKLGVNGTFIFSGVMYILAEVFLFDYFNERGKLTQFGVLQLFFIPIVIYFIYWWKKVMQDRNNANFHYSLRMNFIAAASTNVAFVLLYFFNHPIA